MEESQADHLTVRVKSMRSTLLSRSIQHQDGLHAALHNKRLELHSLHAGREEERHERHPRHQTQAMFCLGLKVPLLHPFNQHLRPIHLYGKVGESEQASGENYPPSTSRQLLN